MNHVQLQTNPTLSAWEADELIPFLRYAFSHTNHYDHNYIPCVLQARNEFVNGRTPNLNSFPNADFESVFLRVMHRHSIRDEDVETIVGDVDILARYLVQKYMLEGEYELLGRSEIASKAWLEKRRAVEKQQPSAQVENQACGGKEVAETSYPEFDAISAVREPYWLPLLRDQGRAMPTPFGQVPPPYAAPPQQTYQPQTTTVGMQNVQHTENGRWVQSYNIAGHLEPNFVAEGDILHKPHQLHATQDPLQNWSQPSTQPIQAPVSLPMESEDNEMHLKFLKFLAHRRSLERQALGLEPVRPWYD